MYVLLHVMPDAMQDGLDDRDVAQWMVGRRVILVCQCLKPGIVPGQLGQEEGGPVLGIRYPMTPLQWPPSSGLQLRLLDGGFLEKRKLGCSPQPCELFAYFLPSSFS